MTTTSRSTWVHLGLAALVLGSATTGCGKGSMPEGDPHTGAEPAAAPDPADAPPADAPASNEGDAGPGDPAPSSGASPEGPKAEPAAKDAAAQEAPRASAMDLSGKLSPAQIAKFVEEHQSYFDPCIAIVEKGGPTYKVSITTKAYVGPMGRVNTTEVLKSTSKDKSFDTCVTDAFKKIHFGKPKEGATATLTFPMTFSGDVE